MKQASSLRVRAAPAEPEQLLNPAWVHLARLAPAAARAFPFLGQGAAAIQVLASLHLDESAGSAQSKEWAQSHHPPYAFWVFD
jgi:hypothetical protein